MKIHTAGKTKTKTKQKANFTPWVLLSQHDSGVIKNPVPSPDQPLTRYELGQVDSFSF
jgi:hypothetical protein